MKRNAIPHLSNKDLRDESSIPEDMTSTPIGALRRKKTHNISPIKDIEAGALQIRILLS
jgi:hypothetical protein